MEITYDKSVHAMYITLNTRKVAKTIEATKDVIIDLDANGRPIGIELLGVTGKHGYVDNAEQSEHIVYPDTQYISVPEMAAMHDVPEHTIRRHLWDGKIPGAIKTGEGKRGTWYIPEDAAKAWTKDRPGRKKTTP